MKISRSSMKKCGLYIPKYRPNGNLMFRGQILYQDLPFPILILKKKELLSAGCMEDEIKITNL